ncbi:MAG: LuxR C-terminal-related transcriptional regulator [Eggerthellaceae bacterium]|nr:LuxR C-terminal-related transcriptional regulator [Eggerthellaceae bacterium]
MEDADVRNRTVLSTAREAARVYAPLLPTIIGLVCARDCIIVGSYGSYVFTDEGLFTDGATLVSLIPSLIVIAWLALNNVHFTKRQVNAIGHVAIALQSCTLALLFVMEDVIGDPDELFLFLHALNEFLGYVNIGYWLLRVRGCSTSTAVVVTMGALALSEVVLLVFASMPNPVDGVCSIFLALVQIPLIRAARKRPQAFEIESPTQENDYFAFMEEGVSSSRFLMVTGLGIGFFSVVIGLLRGYPAGEGIALGTGHRVAYALIAIGLCAYIMLSVLRGRTRVMTVGVWQIMQMLGCLAILAYVLLPGDRGLGACFSTALNALMVVFNWYVIVAFMSYGYRDPWYYALSGLGVFLLPRALARMAEGVLAVLGADPVQIIAIMGVAMILSAQFIMGQLTWLYMDGHRTRTKQEDQAEPQDSNHHLMRNIMGLEAAKPSISHEETMLSTMQQGIHSLGTQFLLTEREEEVLVQYALGKTQQRVAEELFISPGTVHAHIKRIYAKTGLHSRQDVLDYLREYAD